VEVEEGVDTEPEVQQVRALGRRRLADGRIVIGLDDNNK
jgi:hypothetical protein